MKQTLLPAIVIAVLGVSGTLHAARMTQAVSGILSGDTPDSAGLPGDGTLAGAALFFTLASDTALITADTIYGSSVSAYDEYPAFPPAGIVDFSVNSDGFTETITSNPSEVDSLLQGCEAPNQCDASDPSVATAANSTQWPSSFMQFIENANLTAGGIANATSDFTGTSTNSEALSGVGIPTVNFAIGAPEPTTWIMIVTGLGAAAWIKRRQSKKLALNGYIRIAG